MIHFNKFSILIIETHHKFCRFNNNLGKIIINSFCLIKFVRGVLLFFWKLNEFHSQNFFSGNLPQYRGNRKL